MHSIRHSTRLWTRENNMPSFGMCVIIMILAMNRSSPERETFSHADHERLVGSSDIGPVFKCVSPTHNSLYVFSVSIILHCEACKSVIIYNF